MPFHTGSEKRRKALARMQEPEELPELELESPMEGEISKSPEDVSPLTDVIDELNSILSIAPPNKRDKIKQAMELLGEAAAEEPSLEKEEEREEPEAEEAVEEAAEGLEEEL